MDIRCYRDLLVWQRAMDLVKEAYHLKAHLPRSEKFGLKSQMRRAAVSIPSNIAEGHSRRHTREFQHHLSISLGSLAELETQIQLSLTLNLPSEENIERGSALCEEVGGMLHGLIQAIHHGQC
jgi:four helix bundle protein